MSSRIDNTIGNVDNSGNTTFSVSSALHLAISTNCELFVRKLLKDGADANESLKVENVSDYYNDQSCVSPSECIFRHDDEVKYQVFPIHVAIMNCYFNCRRGSGQYQRARALGIVKALLEFDADPVATCFGVHFVKLGEQEFETYVASAETGRAFNLIASLKEYPLKGHADACRDMMDDLTFLLLDESDTYEWGRAAIVPHAVKGIWANLLFHKTYSDITFVCQDGTQFPAHKCVLAAASDYFATAFQGPWQESNGKGKWPTSKPSVVIRLLLTYIYTGEFNDSTFSEFSNEALETAFEFNVPAFQEVCERHCVKHLNTKTIRSLLLMATIYDATTLKNACFRFMESNLHKVMFDPNILSLSTEYPKLWQELARHCAPIEDEHEG